jgi:uncharacterized protein
LLVAIGVASGKDDRQMTAVSLSEGVVVDTSRSPYSRLRPVPVEAVSLHDEFWSPRQRRNREATLPAQLRLLRETGRLDNLRRVTGDFDGPFQGRYFNDSDVYKWLEAASWSLGGHPDPQLEREIDEVIAIVAAAQRPDGYLDSYFELERAGERWTDFDLHEMYCAGHLFQAAVAHYRATGKRSLLDVAIRLADHIDATFGPPAQGKRVGTDGHPEVEMGLIELARVTGDRRYVDLTRFLVDIRGHGVLGDAYDRYGREYHQDHRPFRELDEIVGHAVRAVYLNAGVADLYAETGETALLAALHRLWESMTERKMYVTGGIGSRWFGEAFGADYELPNALAYTETCAAIGSIMWNWRMLAIEGNPVYADLIERTLYNAVLPGVALDGETFFYQNPLADEGRHRRQLWFETACCPPNVARLFASLPGYFYSLAGDDIWVHHFAESIAALRLPDGRSVELRQQTRYPWDGEIAIEVRGEDEFGLQLRIPDWCETGASISVNGNAIEGELTPGSYALVRRSWRPGDVVQLSLPMPVRRIRSHPRVAANTGRTALMRGPLVYCIEQADHPGVDIRDLVLPDDADFREEWRPDLLDGVVIFAADVMSAPVDAVQARALYQTRDFSHDRTQIRTAEMTAIPYFAWANREPGPMRVWIRRGPD